MKIHDFALLTGINAETIRSYRLKGLIHPAREKNGYYDYTIADFVELAYVRKMREFQVPLQNIQQIYEGSGNAELIGILKEEISELNQQIAQFQKQVRFLELECQHVSESDYPSSQVQVMESTDEKIDYYDLKDIPKELLDSAGRYYLTQTPVIRIPKEILNGPIEDRRIRIQTGLGTYLFMLEERGIPVNEHAVIIPHGKCLSMMVLISNLEEMDLLQIAPMMQYAEDRHLKFLSDTTGYLARVERRDGKMLYHFRIRACIEIHVRTRKAG